MDSRHEQQGPGQLLLLESSKLQEVDMRYACFGGRDVTGQPLPTSIADACSDFLSRLSRTAPNIHKFNFLCVGDVPPLRSCLTSFVNSMHNLTAFASRTISLHPLAIFNLARLSSLEDLRLIVHDDDWSEEWKDALQGLPEDSFPALGKLDLLIDDVGLCMAILDHISSRRLWSLALALSGQQSITGVSKCLAILPEQSFVGLLRKVNLDLSRTASPPSSPPAILYASDLKPLFRLGLTDLVISGCSFAISNELIREMSEAWPNIVVLRLMDNKGTSPYSVTLPGLLAFVYNCPLLKELGMKIDASIFSFPHPLPEMRPAFGAEQRALRMLFPGHGLISDPYFVAGFIADCFPECNCVLSSWSRSPPDFPRDAVAVQGALWNEAWKFVKHFAKVRAQERHGALVAGVKMRDPADPAVVLQYAEIHQSNPIEATRIAIAHGLWYVHMHHPST